MAKPSSQFIISLQLQDAMVEFYRVMEEVLNAQNMPCEIEAMKKMIHSRQKPLKAVELILNKAGFNLRGIMLKQFFMTFLDGTTFFNHGIIRNEFLPEWINILYWRKNAGKQSSLTFREFKVSIPYAVLDCTIRPQ